MNSPLPVEQQEEQGAQSVHKIIEQLESELLDHFYSVFSGKSRHPAEWQVFVGVSPFLLKSSSTQFSPSDYLREAIINMLQKAPKETVWSNVDALQQTTINICDTYSGISVEALIGEIRKFTIGVLVQEAVRMRDVNNQQSSGDALQ